MVVWLELLFADKTVKFGLSHAATMACVKVSSAAKIWVQFRAPFSYGAGARADRQLKALAVISQVALQTVSHSCSKSSQPIRMVGWNGQELPIREYSWSINYELDSDLRCKV